MFVGNRVLVCTSAAVMALALAACGNHAPGASSTGAAPQASATGGAAAPAGLEITSWGPDSTKAGVVFNAQPGGNAALWVRVNRPLDGDEAAVEFNGTLLQANISGNLITVGVPKSLYATPGIYKMHVVARKGEQSVQSNDVQFTVK
jgi:hypothetical protein